MVEFCKWIAIYTLAIAVETYHANVAKEQEVLGEIADLISMVYALDSVVLRVAHMLQQCSPPTLRPRTARSCTMPATC